MKRNRLLLCSTALALLASCGKDDHKEAKTAAPPPAPPVYFKVDPATAGTLTGRVRFTGKKPEQAVIDMDQDADCAKMHPHGRVMSGTTVVNKNGTLANVFVYIKAGMEGRKFEPPSKPATMDQNGCWFEPRVLGIETGQTLNVTNSDPVTHNIHPVAHVNREWNHSQAPGDPPIVRHFVKPEIMIPVKCNIHHWMHAYIGVVDNPYFAVTGTDGSFELRNLPPGNYTLAAWHEQLGEQEMPITIKPSGTAEAAFTFQGK